MRYTLGFDNMTYAPGTPGTPEGAQTMTPYPGIIAGINRPLPADGENVTQAAGKAADSFPWWLLLVAGAAWYI